MRNPCPNLTVSFGHFSRLPSPCRQGVYPRSPEFYLVNPSCFTGKALPTLAKFSIRDTSLFNRGLRPREPCWVGSAFRKAEPRSGWVLFYFGVESRQEPGCPWRICSCLISRFGSCDFCSRP